MPLGETGYTSKGVTIERFTFEPLPTNDYQLRLVTEHLEVAKSKDTGSVPYVNGLRLEALDTATTEGGKNRLIFARLFGGLTSGKKGKCAFEMPNGPVALARALGAELEVPADAIKTVPEYVNGEPTGNAVKYVDPKFIISWLKANEGMVVRAHVRKVKKADQDAKNELAYFIPAEAVVNGDFTTSTNSWGRNSTNHVEKT